MCSKVYGLTRQDLCLNNLLYMGIMSLRVRLAGGVIALKQREKNSVQKISFAELGTQKCNASRQCHTIPAQHRTSNAVKLLGLVSGMHFSIKPICYRIFIIVI